MIRRNIYISVRIYGPSGELQLIDTMCVDEVYLNEYISPHKLNQIHLLFPYEILEKNNYGTKRVVLYYQAPWALKYLIETIHKIKKDNFKILNLKGNTLFKIVDNVKLVRQLHKYVSERLRYTSITNFSKAGNPLVYNSLFQDNQAYAMDLETQKLINERNNVSGSTPE